MPENSHIETKDNSEEIDLIGFIKILIQGKKIIYKFLAVFFCLGLFFAIFTPKEYSASTIFVPQGSNGNKIGGNLGGLASLAGVNIGGGAGESGIPLNLYPEIIFSIPFQRELINTPLIIKEQDKKVTYKEYYRNIYNPGLIANLKKYTIGLPSLLISKIFKSEQNKIKKNTLDSIYYISEEEAKLFDILNKQISLSINDDDNYVKLSLQMPEAIASAQMALRAEKLLEKYIISYKVKKSSEKLAFIKKRYKEKLKTFKEKQYKLVNFKDRNRYSSTSRSKTRLITLQSEYDLAFNVLNELAKQIETQQIQVKENTPIFTVVKPVSVPIIKSKPKRLFIISSFLLLGLVFSIVKVFFKVFFKV